MKYYFKSIHKEVLNSLGNYFNDNWDFKSYPIEKSLSSKDRLKFKIAKFLKSFGLIRVNDIESVFEKMKTEIETFELLFNLLENNVSRNLLIRLLCYRGMGHRRVKLPINNEKYWKGLNTVETLIEVGENIDPKFSDYVLYKFNLEKLGFPIKIYFNKLGILVDFIVKQYEYEDHDFKICAHKDEVVIDGGGCWGDTALYFSNQVGENGKVYVFEFISGNIDILKRNLELNPDLKNSIELVRHPLWSVSGTDIFFSENGPASKVSTNYFQDSTGKTQTLSIDDLVNNNCLTRLDFIKLDIEGAELEALKGAINSLTKFRPKLAIALYHDYRDFRIIPKYLDDLNLGYKFYLSHCTMSKAETILFATTV